MKHYLYILTLIVLTQSVWGQQNMVPNGNFEYYSYCPNAYSQTYLCTGWSQFNYGTSDYFNICGTNGVGIPFNFFGYQEPASGQGYMGGYIYTGKEYLYRHILPLQVGVTYEVSLSVNLANYSRWGVDDISIFFYDTTSLGTPPISNASLIPPGIIPQVSFKNYGPISDTSNWVRLVASFYADSAYDNIVIGSFNQWANIDTAHVGGGSSYCYYYYDSVVVKVANSITLNLKDSLFCAGDTIKVPYTVNLLNYFNNNNIFSVQLSDPNGNFAAPVVIGSHTGNTNDTITCVIPSSISAGGNYRMRIISSSPVDYSNITKTIGIGTTVAKPDATSNSPICPGANITLAATTTTGNTALRWKWTGPGGFSSNLQSPVISSANSINTGDYVITASVYGCKSKDTINVTVLSALGPSGAFAGSNAPACTNDTLKLFATTMYPGVVYQWIGPNNFISNLQNPAISNPTFAAAGDYIVDATYLNCLVKDTVSVSILTPSFTVSASGNNPVCNGGTFVMTSSGSASGISYTWSGPFGFSASGSNTNLSNVTTANAGDYVVTGSFNGCSVKDTLTLVVNPLPAKPQASSNTPICSGSTLNLTGSTTGVTYNWTGPNSFTSSAQNPSITNTTTAASGDYIVTVTLTSTGCSAKDTETVLVKPTPVVFATSNSPACEGSALNISSTATPTGTISWAGPNSFSSSTQNPTITNANPNASGDYIISVTLNGCTGKDTTTVIVNPQPIIPLTGSNTPVCVGMGLNLTAASNAGASYSWTGPNSFSSALQTPTRNNVVLADAGTYSVTATLNGCTSVAGTTTVMVNPAPFVTIYSNPADSICQGSSVTFVALPANTGTPAYKWTKNSSPSVLSTNNTFITSSLNNNDIIRCEMTDPGKCGTAFSDTSNELKMTVLPLLAPSVSISSNPTTPLSPYELVTFTAIPVNAGNHPKYQWQRNSSDVIGATSNVWATQQLSNNDSVSVLLTSDYKCPQPKTAGSNKIKVTVLTGIKNVKGISYLALYPNPNNGSFIIKGSVNSNETVTLQILNASGQLVYENKTATKNKELFEQVDVQHLPGGLYMLRLNSKDNIRFTIER